MSNYNPYAPPVAAAEAAGEVPVRGEPQPWDVGDAIRNGWEIYKAHWAPLTFGYFLSAMIGMIPGQVAPTLVLTGVLEQGSRPYYAVHLPLSFVGWVIAEFFNAGFTRAALRAVYKNECSIGDFFGVGSQFLSYLVASFLRSLAVAVGIVLLVVPGIIAGLGFSNAPWFVMDQKLGPIDALKASWDVSEGQKGALFVLGLAEVGLLLLGVAACCFGMFVAMPVVMVAHAIVYTRMAGTARPLTVQAGPYSPPGGGPPPGPGGPGYGPPGYGPGPGYGPPPGYGGWGPPGGQQ